MDHGTCVGTSNDQKNSERQKCPLQPDLECNSCTLSFRGKKILWFVCTFVRQTGSAC